MQDILGNTLKVGDIVAHGQRCGNSGMISVKVILDSRVARPYGNSITEVKVAGYDYISKEFQNGKWVTIKNPFYKLSRPGWTTPGVLVLLDKSVPKDVRNFLESQVKKV